MIVRYDALKRLEKPNLVLCNPGSVYSDGHLSNVVGILTDHEAEEVTYQFNATSELNFRVNKTERDDPYEREYANNMFRAVQNRRLVFLEGIGYFMITGVTDGFDGHIRYKDVRAESIDAEIMQKKVPYIADGTYRFQTEGGNKGLLETIVEVLPLWTIGEVDTNVQGKWRTFEDVDVDKNCLSFMIEDMQNAYECIFLFDIKERTINVFDQNNYVSRTSIHLTKADVINSLEIEENADDIYTAVSVLGDDNVTIAPINPLGGNVIYNFDYYLSWMTPSLRERVEAWSAAVDAAMDNYYVLNQEYYDARQDMSIKQSEVDRLNIQMTMYQRCRDNVVADGSVRLVSSYNSVIEGAGGDPVVIDSTIENLDELIADVLSQLDTLIAACQANMDQAQVELNDANQILSDLSDQIIAIHSQLAITSYFTETEYGELANYIYEGSYRDEYVTITDSMTYPEQFEQMQTLYTRAKAQLDRVSKPTQQFTIDAENFVFIQEFQDKSEQLETGCLINVELDDNDIAALFLSSISINYDDRVLNLTFGNRFNKFDPKSLFENVLGSVTKSANTLNYIKEILYPIKAGAFNKIQEALQTSRDITMGSALASQNQEVVIDGSGYTGRELQEDGEYDPHQIKITGRNIVFTDDAWDTCRTAIGEILLGEDGEAVYGINAEAIIGDIIMGNQLRIMGTDENGNPIDIFTVIDNRVVAKADEFTVDSVTTSNGFTFNQDGLTIYDNNSEIQNLLDNTGMYVRRVVGGEQPENVLVANADGVEAINLTAKQYLIVGTNSRFEDYDDGTDGKRTGCFFIG